MSVVLPGAIVPRLNAITEWRRVVGSPRSNGPELLESEEVDFLSLGHGPEQQALLRLIGARRRLRRSCSAPSSQSSLGSH
jgi:hypothetical protein